MTVSVTLTFEDIDAAGRAMQILSLYKNAPTIDHGMTPGTQVMVETIGQVPVQRAVQVADAAIEKAAAVRAPKQPKAEKPAATQPAVEPAESTALTAPVETVSESPSEITYDVVAKAITDGVKTNRAKVVAALTKFGVKKGTELKPEQYGEFLEMLA